MRNTKILLILAIIISNCVGCASIGSYSLSKNGNFKFTNKRIEAEKTEYFLGTRVSSEFISGPVIKDKYPSEIALKMLFILDFPLTITTDAVLLPFIGIKNIGKADPQ